MPLDGLGVVHQAGAFGKQVFEFIDENGEFVRRNGAERLGRSDDRAAVQLWVKYFSRFAGDWVLAHGEQDCGSLFDLAERGLSSACAAKILEIHHGFITRGPRVWAHSGLYLYS